MFDFCLIPIPSGRVFMFSCVCLDGSSGEDFIFYYCNGSTRCESRDYYDYDCGAAISSSKQFGLGRNSVNGTTKRHPTPSSRNHA
jgi:hypothetical protein